MVEVTVCVVFGYMGATWECRCRVSVIMSNKTGMEGNTPVYIGVYIWYTGCVEEGFLIEDVFGGTMMTTAEGRAITLMRRADRRKE